MGTKREHRERAKRRGEADRMSTADLISPDGAGIWSAKKAGYVPVAYAATRDLCRVLRRIGRAHSSAAVKATYGPPSMRREADRAIREYLGNAGILGRIEPERG